MKALLHVALAVMSLLYLAHVQCVSGEATTSVVFLSDFHFDGFFGTSEGFGPCNYAGAPWQGLGGCDTSIQLAEATVRDVFTRYNPTHIIITGDWLRHGMNRFQGNMSRVAVETVTNITRLFRRYTSGRAVQAVLPHPNIAPTFGNEDFLPDYHYVVNRTVHPNVRAISNVFEAAGMITSAEAETFGRCAYYARNLEGTRLTLIALNTLVWSKSLQPRGQSIGQDPCGQLAWLSEQLHAAQQSGRKAYLLSHIPPADFWHESLYVAYRTIVEKYRSTVAADIFGHTHKFILFSPPPHHGVQLPPIYDMSSITRASHSNPSYMHAVVSNASYALQSLTQVVWDNTTSRYVEGKTLPGALGMSNLSPTAIQSLVASMKHNATLYHEYITMFNGGALLDLGPKYLNPKFRDMLLCGMTAESPSSADACHGQHLNV